jgi:hypothetical protein
MDKKWVRTKPVPPDIAQRLAQLPTILAAEGVLLGSLAQQNNGNDVALVNDVALALLLPTTRSHTACVIL